MQMMVITGSRIYCLSLISIEPLGKCIGPGGAGYEYTLLCHNSHHPSTHVGCQICYQGWACKSGILIYMLVGAKHGKGMINTVHEGGADL